MSLLNQKKNSNSFNEKAEFTEVIQIRVTRPQRSLIKQIVKKNPERFGNESHFGRVAFLKLMREFKK